MSKTKNFAISADALIVRSSGGSNLGAGAGSHLVAGLYSGYIFRSLLLFALDWTNVTKIVSATLWLKNADQNHISYGGSPKFDIFRNTASFSEGTYSCESGYSASNSVVYPGPACGLKNTSATLSAAQNTWVSIPITQVVEEWAPATVLKSDGVTKGDAQVNRGLTIRSYDEASTSRTLEWYSRSSSYDPYIALVYEDNSAPTTPVLSGPSGKYASTAGITMAFTATDPDAGDTLAAYDIEVSTSSALNADGSFVTKTPWSQINQTTGISGWSVSRSYGGTALVGGTTYYWHARVKDAAGAWSPWAVAKSFSLNRPPTISVLPNGGANGVLAIHNLALLANTLTPSPEVPFTVSDADGDKITEYEVEITGTGANEVVTGLSLTSGTAVVRKSTKTLVNGTGYQVRIRAKDALEYGPWSAYTLFRVWYGQAVYEWLVPAGSSGWSVSTPGVNAGRFQLLYRSATGVNGAGAGTWRTSLPTSGTYFNIMVRTCSLTGTAPARPQVGSVRIDYTTTATPPYSWGFVGTGTNVWTIDSGVRRYGINSLKCDLDAATASGQTIWAWQDIAVSPDQTYTFSVWVKGSNIVAAGNVSLRVYVGGGTSTILKLLNLSSALVTEDWQRMVMTLSPDELAGNSSIRVGTFITRAGLPTGTIWFDGAMLAEGAVAPAWSPALIGLPAVFDANGAVIDASQGGIFQLIGSAGGARDLVELGTNGLKFGGDTEWLSPTPGSLQNKGPAAANASLNVLAVAGQRSSMGAQVGADINARAVLFGDNTLAGLEFGPGSSARDTNLFRGGVDYIRTNDALWVDLGVKTFVKAGAPVDADFPTGFVGDGIIAINTSTLQIYVRIGGVWRKTVAMT